MDQRKTDGMGHDVVDGRLINGRKPEPESETGKYRHRSGKKGEKNDRENKG